MLFRSRTLRQEKHSYHLDHGEDLFIGNISGQSAWVLHSAGDFLNGAIRLRYHYARLVFDQRYPDRHIGDDSSHRDVISGSYRSSAKADEFKFLAARRGAATTNFKRADIYSQWRTIFYG
ncbi:MAG: hypothetical protein R2794_04755 [Chitinophagales bacterium]